MPRACFVVAVAAVACAACTDVQAPTRVRFAVDDDVAARTVAPDAAPLFGPVDEVRAAHVAGAPDLARWWTVDADDADAVVAALRARGVREFSVEPRWQPAVVAVDDARDDGPSCPVKTPIYDARQRYRAAVGIDEAWSRPGGRGQGVAVADVEGAWNAAHEDLPGARVQHVAGARIVGAAWRAHGTAVLGVLAARDDDKGMTGLVPDVSRVVTASIGGIGAARAIFAAAVALAPGDVLVVELHGPGPNHRGRGQQGYVPIEWWQPEYDAIRFATAKGVVVVEAAGNGGEDLDAPIYGGTFDRRVRDSGAILVGAGAPPGVDVPERARLAFSNFGARVDVQGWGALVATLDYGDLQSCAAHSRKYTARFAGTSSASPVVAGVAVAVQGVARARLGAPLSPAALRALLVDTGTPQVGADHIGPLPHAGRAIASVVSTSRR